MKVSGVADINEIYTIIHDYQIRPTIIADVRFHAVVEPG
jgi:hypothetical protein